MTGSILITQEHSMLRKGLAGVMLIIVSLLFAGNAHAQTVDTTPPVIELEELLEGVATLSQVFTVQIAEDGVLEDAVIYYRRSGQQPYTPVTMTPLGTSGYFSVTIETDPEDLRPIEYYVQARDEAGNRSVSGFAFEPYIRSLSPADSVAEEEEPPAEIQQTNAPPATEHILEKRWVQITLGVVAVGIAASVLSDDGGTDSTLVPVNINLE